MLLFLLETKERVIRLLGMIWGSKFRLIWVNGNQIELFSFTRFDQTWNSAACDLVLLSFAFYCIN